MPDDGPAETATREPVPEHHPLDDVQHPAVRLRVRPCAGCGQRDDHPRHVTAGQLPWHMDCHAMAGCTVCRDQLAACGTSTAPDGVIGRVLQNRLRGLDPTASIVEAPAAEREG